MYLYQPICAKCGRSMSCKKNGVYATWSATHRRVGDLFECPECGCQVLQANSDAINSVAVVAADREVLMTE